MASFDFGLSIIFFMFFFCHPFPKLSLSLLRLKVEAMGLLTSSAMMTSFLNLIILIVDAAIFLKYTIPFGY